MIRLDKTTRYPRPGGAHWSIIGKRRVQARPTTESFKTPACYESESDVQLYIPTII